jgi:hypothetical protein
MEPIATLHSRVQQSNSKHRNEMKLNRMNDIWPDISPSQKRDAYYQAGHAVIAVRESLEVVQVSIQDTAASWIDVNHPNLSQSCLNSSETARSAATSVIRALLAGPAAQSRYSFGTFPTDSPLPDFNLADREMLEQEAVWRAISLAGKISKNSPSIIRSLWRETSGLIQGERVWPAIDAVANMLLITGELAGCEVHDIARHAMGSNDASFR